jgi:nitroreductase
MDFIDTMRQRRAINFFDPDEPLADEDLKNIIQTASLAPSGLNLQPWQVIVVRSQEAKEKLMAAASRQTKIVEAPVTLIILADTSGWRGGHPTVEKTWGNLLELGYMKPEQREWFEKGAQKLYGTPEKSLAFAVKNAAFFSMALMLAAKDAGLDSHPMDGFDQEAVRKAFDVPENFFIPLLIAIGHFNRKSKLMPPKWRKSYEEVVYATF